MKKRLNFKKRYLFCVLFITLGLSINMEENEFGEVGAIEKWLAEVIAGQVTESVMPISQPAIREETGRQNSFAQNFMLNEFPIMVQAIPASGNGAQAEYEETMAKNETSGEEILAGMLAENGNGQISADEGIIETQAECAEEVVGEVSEDISGEVFTDVTDSITNGFQKAEKINSYDFEALSEYQTLVSTFYTIDAGTTAGSNELNLEKLMSKDMTVSKDDPGPQILIYHTHSLESFIDSVPGDQSQTIVGVGDRLAEILTEEYGYSVLHHTEEYDTTRDDAYANSLPGIQKVLEENPSIQVVIDLHRDAGVEGVHRAITLNGKSTATFMLFNGLSRTRKTGDIDYLYNPYLEDNLAFSFQMQLKAGEYYPGLTRKIYLKAYRYNMHLMPKTLLIELGDSNNTVEEVMNTCDPLAHILDMVLSGEE